MNIDKRFPKKVGFSVKKGFTTKNTGFTSTYTYEYRQYALDREVLAVAKIMYFNKELFDWAVYCTAVPGQNHNDEYIKVTTTGSKVRKDLAILMFPGLPVGKYRR